LTALGRVHRVYADRKVLIGGGRNHAAIIDSKLELDARYELEALLWVDSGA